VATLTASTAVRIFAATANKRIGDLCSLSHRTVSSQLYRIFPKLGIATDRRFEMP
jgi:DNA-binding NarL/FixJ family response regulator